MSAVGCWGMEIIRYPYCSMVNCRRCFNILVSAYDFMVGVHLRAPSMVRVASFCMRPSLARCVLVAASKSRLP